MDVGNRKLKGAAGAVAVQGIAGKLPGVVEKTGLGWLEEEAVAKAGPPLLDAGAAQPLPSVFPGNDIQGKVCLEVSQLNKVCALDARKPQSSSEPRKSNWATTSNIYSDVAR